METEHLRSVERCINERMHEKRGDLHQVPLRLTGEECRAINATAHARGFQDLTEYLLSLVWTDRVEMGLLARVGRKAS